MILRLEKPDAYLRYLDLPGRGRPIVFIHGLGCASTIDYPRVVVNPAVAPHRCVLVDLFGHGYSDAPADFDYSIESHAASVATLIEDLALQAPIVYGHSMGGSVAITLTARRPNLVSALVLSESNLNPGGGFISKGIAAQSEADFIATGHARLVERCWQEGWTSRVATFRAADAVGLHRSAVSLVAGSRPTWAEQLFAIKLPRSWIVGDKSNPQEDVEMMKPHGIPVFIVPDAGHDMAFENPDGVAEAIAAALG